MGLMPLWWESEFPEYSPGTIRANDCARGRKNRIRSDQPKGWLIASQHPIGKPRKTSEPLTADAAAVTRFPILRPNL